MTFRIPEDEKEIFIIRKHWFVLLETLFPMALVFILGVGVIFIFSGNIFPTLESLALKIFLTSALALILWSISFIVWTNWHLDVWVVTEKRIYDVQQQSLFSREVSELRLERLQDITVEVRGFVSTFLDIGNLHVQSAGASREFSISHIRHPYKARDIISSHVDSSQESNQQINKDL